MTLGHFIYIPGMLMLGIVIGFVLGARKAELASSQDEEKDQRRAARDARRRAREQVSVPSPAPVDESAVEPPNEA